MGVFRRAFLSEKQPQAASPSARLFFSHIRLTLGKGLWLLLCLLLTVCLFKFSYPSVSISLLAWLAFAPFIMGLLLLGSFWRSFWYGWATGICVYGALYYWVFVTCHNGGGMETGLSVAAWLGLSGLMALQFAIFGGSCYYLKNLQGFFPFVAACGWVALEWLHEILATYFIGFPWFSLAYSQWNALPFLQLAAIGGASSLSFVIAFTGISTGYGLMAQRVRQAVGQFLIAAAVLLSVFFYGKIYLKQVHESSLLRLSVAVMQPDIDQYKKWDEQFELEIWDTMDIMARQAALQKPVLLVWPENMTPGPAQEKPYLDWITHIGQQTDSWQIVGSTHAEKDKQYVSAVLFSPAGQEKGIYDKVHLVPFGEFIPLENIVRSLFSNIEVLGELGFFTAGVWEQPLLQLNQISLGSTICYESLFSHLWRQQTRAGAHLFLNLTNDAWFFDTDAPYQHLAAVVLRAVENRRTVLRAANTGISAVIAPTGEIVARAELNTRAVLVADMALPLGKRLSFYSQWGPWFAELCVLVFMTSMLSVLILSRE